MEYQVIRSNRKTLSLSINDELIPVIKAPCFVSDNVIHDFVEDNQKWIVNALEKKKKYLQRVNISDDEMSELISEAKRVIPDKVKYFSNLMDLYPTGVKITKAKKRFGSCNGKNSLCFSCFLMNYPDKVIDYVVVHELAHIKHHNHSAAFYELIRKYIPDYKEYEKILRNE